MNPIEQYHNAIVGGQIITSKRVAKQYQKIVNDLNNPHSSYTYDSHRANKAINFIEKICKQSKGEWAGKPIKLMLFQKAFVASLFGIVSKTTGKRRYNEAMLMVGRKNGKSTLLAPIALYMQIADGEAGAEVYSVATQLDQAKLTFTEAVNMVKQSPALNKLLKKRKTDLYLPDNFSTFRALSSNANSLDGLNPHCVVIDELHAIKDRNVYEVMKQGMGTRNEPLLVMITTAGTVRENIFDDMYEYACSVVDDIKIDDRFLPILYELDARDEWTEPSMWVKANPGLGTIRKLEPLIEEVERAKTNPKELKGVLCKYFNIRETETNSWLSVEDIENQETFGIEEFYNCYGIGGVDLSATTDLTCATIILMKKDSQKKYVLQKYFLPKNLIGQRAKEDNMPYDVWEQRGLLKGSGNERIDYNDVTNWFIEMRDKYKIYTLWIGYDRWGTQYWKQQMEDYGFQMEDVAMGYKTLSQPSKILEADLKAKLIIYNNNPILKVCLYNTAIKRDENDNIRPVKGNNIRARIDGAMSLLIAYVMLLKNEGDYLSLI